MPRLTWNLKKEVILDCYRLQKQYDLSESSEEESTGPEDTSEDIVVSNTNINFMIKPPKLIVNNIHKMTEQINKPIPLDVIKFIFPYDGNSYELFSFVTSLETLYRDYCSEDIIERNTNHFFIYSGAKSKLQGPARVACADSNHLADIINTLKRNFADNRPARIIRKELMSMTSYKDEHPMSFLTRLEEKRSQIRTQYRLAGKNEAALTELDDQLDEDLIDVFCSGVHSRLGELMENLQPINLSDIRNKLITSCQVVMRNLGYDSAINVVNGITGHYQANPFFAGKDTYNKSKNNTKEPRPFYRNPKPIKSNSEKPKYFQQPPQQQQQQKQPPWPFPQQPWQNNSQNFRNNSSQQIKQGYNSQNTVSMRTDNGHRNNNYRFSHELTQLEEQPTNMEELVAQQQRQINELTERFNFLGEGYTPTEPPEQSQN